MLSINQMIIKAKLLEMWKILNIDGYPLQEIVMANLNKNIAETNVTTRSQANSILRPIIGNKHQIIHLIGKGITLWNQSDNSFKLA